MIEKILRKDAIKEGWNTVRSGTVNLEEDETMKDWVSAYVDALEEDGSIAKTNREIMSVFAKKNGCILGIYHNKLDLLSKNQMTRIEDYIGEEYTDVKFKINGVMHVVEIATVDNEKDVMIMTLKDYKDKY